MKRILKVYERLEDFMNYAIINCLNTKKAEQSPAFTIIYLSKLLFLVF
jgi:hypothetical protein